MKNLIFLLLIFLVGCSSDDGSTFSNTPNFDYRDHTMGDYRISISNSYPHFTPNISSHTPLRELHLTVYRSTYADDELIIKGIHGACIYAYMNENEFSFFSIETNFRPQDLGFNITPPCPNCKIYMSGSGSVCQLDRGEEATTFSIRITLNYDGVNLVRYSGSKQLSLPRPVEERNEC